YICSDCFQQNGGHLYEGAGRHTISCTDQGKHSDDVSLALKHYGNWLISMAELGHQPLQRQLLLSLTQAILNNEKLKNASQLEAETGKLPSALYVNAALKLKELDLKDLIKKRSHVNVKISEET